MTLKDFKPGDTVYILRMHRGRNTAPTISETNVESVGRKYLVIGRDTKYMIEDDGITHNYLIEKASYGEESYLFQTKQVAEEYIEHHDLALWLGCFSIAKAEKVPLEKLRKVKEILES